MFIEQRRGVVALAMVATFMVAVDGTIVNLALDQLTVHLGASRSELEWAADAYTLTFAAVMLAAGAITDTLGAKRTFIAGLVVFTVSSAVCAFAGSMLVLNLARLVQGAGAALLLPSALVLATASATDEHTRHRLVGWWAAAGGVGMAAGPLMGGALVAFADWRAVFAVNVVAGVPAVLWSMRSVPSVVRRVRRLDVGGVVTATVLIGGVVFALIEAPARGWGDSMVITAAALAVAGLAAFVWVERGTDTPLLPVGVYANRGFAGTAIQGALFNFAFYGLLFGLSLMLQQGRGLGAFASGLLFLPLTGLISAGNVCSVALVRRIGRGGVLVTGQIILIVSLLAVAWASTADALWPLIAGLLPVGFSSGMLVPTMTSQSIAAVEPPLHGAASAVFNTARQVGSAVGIATFGPLLGTTGNIRAGFVTCALVGAAAITITLALTPVVTTRKRRTTADRSAQTARP